MANLNMSLITANLHKAKAELIKQNLKGNSITSLEHEKIKSELRELLKAADEAYFDLGNRSNIHIDTETM